MTDYLLLRLYGPMASWGEIAVGESRHSAVHPSRSALLGLLGTALGIERSDEAGQCALVEGYRFGIKLQSAGSPLRDYHTVQVGVAPRKFQFRSRRQELAADKVETILSSREYRCDSLALVAVEVLPDAPAGLDDLAQACFLLLCGIELLTGQQQSFKRGIELWVLTHIHVFTYAVRIEATQCFFCTVRAISGWRCVAFHQMPEGMLHLNQAGN